MYNQGIVPDVPKFFGRRKGRVVRKAKQFLLEKMLPQMRVTSAADFDVEKLFGGAKKKSAWKSVSATGSICMARRRTIRRTVMSEWKFFKTGWPIC